MRHLFFIAICFMVISYCKMKSEKKIYYFSINMMVGTEKGQSYSEEQLFTMLRKNGVKNIQHLDFSGPSQSGIISGTT